MLIWLCVLMTIRTLRTVRLMVFSLFWYSARLDWRYSGGVQGSAGTDHGWGPTREQAALNLAGVAGQVGASKIPALVAISVLLLLLH